MMPATQVEINIPSASVATPADGKPYTTYAIACRLPLRTYTVAKRYSEFLALHAALTAQASGNVAPPYTIPPKHWFTSTLNNPVLTEERRLGLEAYLRGILTDPDSRWRNTAAWRTFLNLPASIQSGSGSNGARGSLHGSLTNFGSGDAVSDPTVWLDTHRELVGILQAARERLAARNSAGNARAAQEEGAAAKKQLVKAGSLLNSLETALRKGGDEGDFAAAPRLGDGEMRRRRDLLAAARRERERLEELQANIGRKEDVDHNVRGLERETEKTSGASGSLFNGATSAAGSGKRGAFGKGRVIGKETAQTRELDNAGVLQLQQQLMKDQDEDVNALAAAVRRQRQLAIEINEELETQNEMLTMLDEDVERVQGKVGVAKKRVDKIS